MKNNYKISITIIPSRRWEQIKINQPFTKKSLLWDIQTPFDEKEGIIRFLSLPMGTLLTHILRTDFDNADCLDTFLRCWLNPPIYDVDVHSEGFPVVIAKNNAATLNKAKKYIQAMVNQYLDKNIYNPSISFGSAVTIENCRVNEIYSRLSNVKITLTNGFQGTYKDNYEYQDKIAHVLKNSVNNPKKFSEKDYNDLRRKYTRYLHDNAILVYELTANDIIACALWELMECLRNNIYMAPCKVCKTPMIVFRNYAKCIFCQPQTPPSRRKREELSNSELQEARIEANIYQYINRNYRKGREAFIKHAMDYVKKKNYFYPKSKIENIVDSILDKKKDKKKKEGE